MCVPVSLTLRQLEMQEPHDSPVLLRKRWETPSSYYLVAYPLILFEQIQKHFRTYSFQRERESLCVRSSLHRNVANLPCESFLSKLLEAISLNVSWFLSPFRIFPTHGSPLQCSFFLRGKKKYLFSGDLGINFHAIVFREILCLLHFVLTSLNGRWEKRTLALERSLILLIRTKYERTSWFTKARLILGKWCWCPRQLEIDFWQLELV